MEGYKFPVAGPAPIVRVGQFLPGTLANDFRRKYPLTGIKRGGAKLSARPYIGGKFVNQMNYCDIVLP